MIEFLRRRRRARLRAKPFPETWGALVLRQAPYCGRLSEAERARLYGHMQIFLAEKHFEGCGGFALNDPIRLCIAAQACLLLLNIDVDYYPRLRSILVYEDTFVAQREEYDEAGFVEEVDDVLEGESWDRGAVVLSWADVARDARGQGGRNVVLHEFAHQLDQSDGDADGWPAHLEPALEARWETVMRREFEALCRAEERGRRTLIDPYGASAPGEFFAVVTEAFFLRPVRLRERHTELYELIAAFYRQDTAARFE